MMIQPMGQNKIVSLQVTLDELGVIAAGLRTWAEKRRELYGEDDESIEVDNLADLMFSKYHSEAM